MLQTPIGAVIFDMDGVILDTESISVRAWMAAAAETGFQLTEQHCHEMIGLGTRESMQYIRERVAGSGDLDRLTAVANAHYRVLLELEAVPCKDGLWELLAFLEGHRLPKAIATSTATELARQKLRRSHVLAHFDVVVGGDQVTRGKPAPDIYLLAAERLGQHPSNCLVLEDSGPGIAAAAAAGMRPILIPDLCRVDPQIQHLAFAKVTTLRDVIRLVESRA